MGRGAEEALRTCTHTSSTIPTPIEKRDGWFFKVRSAPSAMPNKALILSLSMVACPYPGQNCSPNCEEQVSQDANETSMLNASCWEA